MIITLIITFIVGFGIGWMIMKWLRTFKRKTIEFKKLKKDEILVIQLDGTEKEIINFCEQFNKAIKKGESLIVNRGCKIWVGPIPYKIHKQCLEDIEKNKKREVKKSV